MKKLVGSARGIFGAGGCAGCSGLGSMTTGIFSGPTALGTALGEERTGTTVGGWQITCMGPEGDRDCERTCVLTCPSGQTLDSENCQCVAATTPTGTKTPAPPAKTPAKTGTTGLVKTTSGGQANFLSGQTAGIPNLALLAAGGLLLGVGLAMYAKKNRPAFGA